MPKKYRNPPPWPTLYALLPDTEAGRAVEYGGSQGLAIFAALHRLRFHTPPEFKSKFFASMEQIAAFSGISSKRLRPYIRKLETGGLVQIERPRGAARLRHEACQYTLVPIFTAENKIGEKKSKASAPDSTKASAPDRTQSIAKMSDKVKSPLKGDITVESPPTPTAAAVAVSAPASPGVAEVKDGPDKTRSEIQRTAALKRYAEKAGMTLEAYLHAKAQGTLPKQKRQPTATPAPAPQRPASAPTPSPAPVVSHEEAMRRSLARALATTSAQPTPAPTDARQFCKPGMAPATHAS